MVELPNDLVPIENHKPKLGEKIRIFVEIKDRPSMPSFSNFARVDTLWPPKSTVVFYEIIPGPKKYSVTIYPNLTMKVTERR